MKHAISIDVFGALLEAFAYYCTSSSNAKILKYNFILGDGHFPHATGFVAPGPVGIMSNGCLVCAVLFIRNIFARRQK
jgi:hypothetical protein